MTVLEEKDVSYQLIPVNLSKGEQATPEFRATKQPFGKVPVLDDDGFLIYESRAICKYIAKRWEGQGTKLIPDGNDARAYGMFEQVIIA
jgi:glutathione S-transferase